MELLSFSYHSTGYFAGSIVAIGLLAYLFTLKNKNRQTWSLMVYFCISLFLTSGFAIRTSILSADWAKPASYLIAIYTAFSNVFLLYFAYHFPRNYRRRESRLTVTIFTIAGIIVYALYVYNTYSEPVVYNFETQFFEFQKPAAARPLSLVLILSSLWTLIVLTRKSISIEREYRRNLRESGNAANRPFGVFRLHSKEARALRAFAAAVLAMTLFSSSYVLYTTNRISWADFQLILTSATIVQFFVYTIIYLNNSPQPTTFMVKLVGVSLVTVLLVLGIVNRFTYEGNESRYDQRRLAELHEIREEVEESDYSTMPPAVRYIAKRPAAGGPFVENYEIMFLKTDHISVDSLASNDEYMESRYLSHQQIRDNRSIDEILSDLRKIDYSEYFTSPEYQGRHPRRLYRSLTPDDSSTYFIRYVIKAGDSLYEIGYDYAPYLMSVHTTAGRMIYFMLLTTVILFVLFPFFYHGGLVNPLNRLLAGVTKVNEGEYDVEVEVQVEDEIGYLSHSFNTMVESIRDARARLQDYADHLEEKVKDRTAELRKTLEQVQNLKIQQDGDYFLTSLLIDPLGRTAVESPDLTVEAFTRQKKQFRFRKWDAEIGGDLTVARRIKLSDRDYTVFLNGDAMGKSIQGAGGALVLGAVFEAILKRTEQSSSVQNQSPERWVKNAFIELHNVFTSFNCSMLVSVVMGLVDEITGVVYYMEAEHPFLVLYRDGEARFVESNYQYRKLGVTLTDSGLNINILQLQPDDILIAGTDGRDDLIIKDPESGEDYIQEDEYLFLRCVEEGNGELEAIFEALRSKGGITDDISMLRIGYQEDRANLRPPLPDDVQELYNEARQLFQNRSYANCANTLEKCLTLLGDSNENSHKADAYRSIIRLLTNAFLRMRRYDRAIEFALEYVSLNPSDTEGLFVVSFCARHIGNLSQAAEFGERVRLRTPDHMRNLMHLVEIYMQSGNFQRANMLLDEAEQNFPENERILQLKQGLQVK